MIDRLIAGRLLASRQHLFNYDGQFGLSNHVTKQTILIKSVAGRYVTLQPARRVLATMSLGVLCIAVVWCNDFQIVPRTKLTVSLFFYFTNVDILLHHLIPL
jgi:hypothetical protein